ncbi:MAG: metallophosphoesterase [Lachnospiraceae bacterium]|nr:metallophosphoesterase [Lachnospiraceae bacterium]
MRRIALRTVTYPVASHRIPAGFDGVHIAVLADLHNCRVGGDNRVLLDAVRENRPDWILLAGDMITDGIREVCCNEALHVLRALTEIAPVCYAPGNHEGRWQEADPDGFALYRSAAEELGVLFLDNTSTFLRRGEDSLRVTGLSLPQRYYSKRKRVTATARDIRALVGAADSVHYQILLAHTPAFARAYSDWGADLSLAGHYHGGVIRLPGLGGMISTGFRPFPRYDRGRYRLGEGELIVSAGLGAHTIPIRVNNPPELVILKLRGGR